MFATKSYLTALLAAILIMVTTIAQAQQPVPVPQQQPAVPLANQQVVVPQQWQATGLNGLSPAQAAQVNQVLQNLGINPARARIYTGYASQYGGQGVVVNPANLGQWGNNTQLGQGLVLNQLGNAQQGQPIVVNQLGAVQQQAMTLNPASYSQSANGTIVTYVLPGMPAMYRPNMVYGNAGTVPSNVQYQYPMNGMQYPYYGNTASPNYSYPSTMPYYSRGRCGFGY